MFNSSSAAGRTTTDCHELHDLDEENFRRKVIKIIASHLDPQNAIGQQEGTQSDS
jgi:hypothetical protein